MHESRKMREEGVETRILDYHYDILLESALLILGAAGRGGVLNNPLG